MSDRLSDRRLSDGLICFASVVGAIISLTPAF